MKRKCLAVGIICLFVLMSVPLVSSNEIPVIEEKYEPVNKGSLLDNVTIECHGIYPIDILFSLLNLPVYYTRIEITNHNDVAIWMNEHIKLEARDGRILIEFNYNSSLSIEPHSDDQTQMFVRNTWHSYFKYTFGFFDLTIDFTIRGVGEHTKLRFHGLVFGFGAVIFNPQGEVIEST